MTGKLETQAKTINELLQTDYNKHNPAYWKQKWVPLESAQKLQEERGMYQKACHRYVEKKNKLYKENTGLERRK